MKSAIRLLKAAAFDPYGDPYDSAISNGLIRKQDRSVALTAERLVDESKRMWEEENDRKSVFDLSKIYRGRGYASGGTLLAQGVSAVAGGAAAWALAKLIRGDRLKVMHGIGAAGVGGLIGAGAYEADKGSDWSREYKEQRTAALARRFRQDMYPDSRRDHILNPYS